MATRILFRAFAQIITFILSFASLSTAWATAPSDQDFSGIGADGTTIAAPRTFNTLVIAADGGATTFVSDKSVFGLTVGTGNVLVVNADDSGSGTYVEIRSSDLTDKFRLVSLDIESFTAGWSDTYTVTGYNGGSATTAVASDTLDLSAADASGSITYVKNSGAVGGTLTFDATWSNIDTIRFTKTSGAGPKLSLDTLNFSPAWVRKPIYTVAGNSVPNGTATNVGTGANGIAYSSAGDIYIADASNHVIRKVNPTTGLSTVIAGTGTSGFSGDGSAATSAKLSSPRGVAVDSNGNVYIADTSNHRIRKINTSGVISTVAGTGTGGFLGDSGAATSARVNSPYGLCVDSLGTVYIADTGNQRIRKMATNGIITTVAGNGTAGFLADNVAATGTRLSSPRGVSVDSSGNLYIADTSNNRIRKVSTGGTITTVAGTGTASYSGDGGAATSATIRAPFGVYIDSSGNLYIADTTNQRIRKVSGGNISTVTGTGTSGYSGDGGTASTAKVSSPAGVVADGSGNVYIADTSNGRVRKVDTSGTITTFAGTGATNYGGDGGLATSAQFSVPNGVAYDSAGNLYLADSGLHRIRKIDSSGVVTTIAGTGVAGFSGDSGLATAAQLNTPLGIAIDSSGNLYIADGNNNRIRKVDTSGVITTVAGTGTGSFGGDNGPATSASLFGVFGVAAFGNEFYIADTGNNRIRKVDSSGTITTIAGTGASAYSGDNGQATSAALYTPIGIALDGNGNVYFTDYNNCVVRKIATNGIITTVAGTGTAGYSGDNGPALSAQLSYPRGVTVDSAGNVYISDTSNNCIRRVDTSGTIFTLAGTGTAGLSGDTGYSEDAQVSFPTAITFSSSGLLAIADSSNRRYRQIGYVMPAISSGLTASATYGTAFSYTITGTNIPINYGATGLPSSLTVDAATGVISGTLAKADLSGSPYSVTLSVTNIAGTAQATLVLTLNKATLGMTGATASRVYDGTTNAAGSLDFSGATLTGKVGSDSVSIDTSGASGSFDTADVGTGKTVTLSSLVLAGSDSNGYQLATITATGAITAKSLTLTGLAADKVYDGTTGASPSGTASLASPETAGTGTTSDGKPYTGDTVSLTGSITSASFATRTVGSGKTVTVSGLSLTGTQNGNYTLTPSFSAEITAKPLNVSGLSGVDKVYDGTTAGSTTGTGALLSSETAGAGSTSDGHPYTSDDVSLLGTPTAVFSSKDVAPGISLTFSGYSISGYDAGNYSITQPSGLTAAILAKTLFLTGASASDKAYNASASASLSGTVSLLTAETAGSGTTLDGKPYAGDTLSLSGTLSGSFADANVGPSKTVTLTGAVLGGAQSGNYVLGAYSTTAAITAKALSVSGLSGVNKTYDGTTTATLSGTAALLTVEAAGSGTSSDGKPYTGDTVSVTGTSTAVFADRHVGTGKALTVSGLTLSGAQAGNYEVTQPNDLSADISAKAVTVSGLSGVDRVYNGTTTVALSGTATLPSSETAGSGTTSDGAPYSVDTVLLTGTPEGTVSTRHSGTAKVVTVAGLSLSGAHAGNYTLSAPAGVTASISEKALSLSGLSGVDKIYDGSTSATLNGTAALLATETAGSGNTSDGRPYSLDGVSITGTPTAVFAGKNVGDTISVSVTGYSLTGTDAGDYSLSSPSGLTASIFAKTLTVSGVTAANKVYDATVSATLSGTAVLQAAETVGTGTSLDGKPYSGDTVTLSGTMTGAFADANVGTTKTITVSGMTLSGAQATNYELGGLSVTATISAKSLTIAGLTGVDKVYDGTPSATLSGTGIFLSTEAPGSGTTTDGKPYVGDAVSLTGTPAAVFSDRHAGNVKGVTVTGYSLTGDQAGNYEAQQPAGLTATISPKELSTSGLSVSDKVYDATDTAILSGTAALQTPEAAGAGSTSDGKAYDLDSVQLTGSPAGAFASKNVGTNHAVTVAGLSLDGAQAGNYAVVAPQGLSGSISVKALQVTGLAVVDKNYDGSATATLTGTATLLPTETAGAGSVADGRPYSGDTLSLAGTPTGSFADANVGHPKAVTITGLSLAGGASTNYTLTAPSGSGSISAAPVSITFTQLEQTYDGTSKSVTVTVTPTMTATVTYDGSSTAPTNAGSYHVVAKVEGNYAGSASDTLVIAKAPQTITFPTAAPASSIVLGATANTGLPITYAIVSGTGSVTNSTLTITGRDAVVVRAIQVGNENYLEANAEQTFSGRTLQAQTITFTAPGDQALGSPPVSLHATASSGLPVVFSVVSGPATMSSDTAVSLTGEGTVTVRASQGGNQDYEPATDVVQSFEVTQPHIYFGTMSPSGQGDQKAGEVAGYLPPSSTHGILLFVIPGSQINAVVEFDLQDNGDFSTTLVLPASTGAARPAVVPTASAAGTLVVTGTLVNGVLAGHVETLNLTFTANLVAPKGTTSSLAGAYTSSGTNTSAGTITSIVGTEGQLLVVAATPTLTTGGSGTVNTSGVFTFTNTEATISGSIDGPSTTISGAITVVDGTPVTFFGTNSLSVRANRLINLSSRAQVGSNDNVLIAGFVIAGTESKAVLLRGVGPTLSEFGLQGVLAKPRLRLYNSTHELIAENAGWSTALNAAAISTAISNTGAFTLPGGSEDSAILETLAPGAYTLQVSGDGGSGVALAELYDASQTTAVDDPRLVNISTRGRVSGGEGALIGGFVVTGNTPVRVLVRGVGPGLAQFGLTDALADPKLVLYSGDNTIVAENNDWQTATPLDSNQQVGTETEIVQTGQTAGAFALESGSKDAALLITLAPGSYTAQVIGVNNTTGVALVEVYKAP